jgi:hypothetical protein
MFVIMKYWTWGPMGNPRKANMFPLPVIIGLVLIALGFGLGIYIIVATIRDRQQVRPLNDDEI